MSLASSSTPGSPTHSARRSSTGGTIYKGGAGPPTPTSGTASYGVRGSWWGGEEEGASKDKGEAEGGGESKEESKEESGGKSWGGSEGGVLSMPRNVSGPVSEQGSPTMPTLEVAASQVSTPRNPFTPDSGGLPHAPWATLLEEGGGPSQHTSALGVMEVPGALFSTEPGTLTEAVLLATDEQSFFSATSVDFVPQQYASHTSREWRFSQYDHTLPSIFFVCS